MRSNLTWPRWLYGSAPSLCVPSALWWITRKSSLLKCKTRQLNTMAQTAQFSNGFTNPSQIDSTGSLYASAHWNFSTGCTNKWVGLVCTFFLLLLFLTGLPLIFYNDIDRSQTGKANLLHLRKTLYPPIWILFMWQRHSTPAIKSLPRWVNTGSDELDQNTAFDF